MGQDSGLEVLQFPGGFDSQFVGQHPPGPPVSLQRLTLATCSIQTQDELPTETLMQRMPSREVLKFADKLGMPSQRQIGPNAHGECIEPLLLQSWDFSLREGFLGELGQRCSAPQRQRLTQSNGGSIRR
jgi:hypothetical protein